MTTSQGLGCNSKDRTSTRSSTYAAPVGVLEERLRGQNTIGRGTSGYVGSRPGLNDPAVNFETTATDNWSEGLGA